MTPKQKAVIEEAVGRRGHFPPGGMQWLDLAKVLKELLLEEPCEATHGHWPFRCPTCGYQAPQVASMVNLP